MGNFRISLLEFDMKKLIVKPRGVASEIKPKLNRQSLSAGEEKDDGRNMLERGAQLVSFGMELRNHIHKKHLTSADYAKHRSLNKYYDDLPDLLDTFAETLQGRMYEKFPAFPPSPQALHTSALPQDAINLFRSFLDGYRKIFQSFPELQALIDDMQILNCQTMYLLTMR